MFDNPLRRLRPGRCKLHPQVGLEVDLVTGVRWCPWCQDETALETARVEITTLRAALAEREADMQRALDREARLLSIQHCICPTCGPIEVVDEDGACSCGAEPVIVADVRSAEVLVELLEGQRDREARLREAVRTATVETAKMCAIRRERWATAYADDVDAITARILADSGSPGDDHGND